MTAELPLTGCCAGKGVLGDSIQEDHPRCSQAYHDGDQLFVCQCMCHADRTDAEQIYYHQTYGLIRCQNHLCVQAVEDVVEEDLPDED